MTWTSFAIIWISCLVTMLVCRCIPIFILKGRDLPERLQRALNLIPTAAFAALVANDLFKTDMFASGISGGIIPLISALVVVYVARKTKSLIFCAISGVATYALLSVFV